jgi:hypothetical protein
MTRAVLEYCGSKLTKFIAPHNQLEKRQAAAPSANWWDGLLAWFSGTGPHPADRVLKKDHKSKLALNVTKSAPSADWTLLGQGKSLVLSQEVTEGPYCKLWFLNIIKHHLNLLRCIRGGHSEEYYRGPVGRSAVPGYSGCRHQHVRADKRRCR